MTIDHKEPADLTGSPDGQSGRLPRHPAQGSARLVQVIARLGHRLLAARQIAVCDLDPYLLRDIGVDPDRVRRLCHLQESAVWRR